MEENTQPITLMMALQRLAMFHSGVRRGATMMLQRLMSTSAIRTSSLTPSILSQQTPFSTSAVLPTDSESKPLETAPKAGDYEYEDPKSQEDVVNITYVLRDGSEKKILGKVGDNVMFLAHR